MGDLISSPTLSYCKIMRKYFGTAPFLYVIWKLFFFSFLPFTRENSMSSQIHSIGGWLYASQDKKIFFLKVSTNWVYIQFGASFLDSLTERGVQYI